VEDGGVLSQRGCVEYTTGNVAPGVFVIITTDDPESLEIVRHSCAHLMAAAVLELYPDTKFDV
jgi:threonyl-tRNA synthetase